MVNRSREGRLFASLVQAGPHGAGWLGVLRHFVHIARAPQGRPQCVDNRTGGLDIRRWFLFDSSTWSRDDKLPVELFVTIQEYFYHALTRPIGSEVNKHAYQPRYWLTKEVGASSKITVQASYTQDQRTDYSNYGRKDPSLSVEPWSINYHDRDRQSNSRTYPPPPTDPLTYLS